MMMAQYAVHTSSADGSWQQHPRPASLHRSLAAAIRAARSYGFHPAHDGESLRAVARIERLADGAQLHPWSNPGRDWQLV